MTDTPTPTSFDPLDSMPELPDPPVFIVRMDQDQRQTALRWAEQLTEWAAQLETVLGARTRAGLVAALAELGTGQQ